MSFDYTPVVSRYDQWLSGYQLQWREQGAGTLTGSLTLAGTSHEATSLAQGANYEWRVRVDTDTERWSEWVAFSTLADEDYSAVVRLRDQFLDIEYDFYPGAAKWFVSLGADLDIAVDEGTSSIYEYSAIERIYGATLAVGDTREGGPITLGLSATLGISVPLGTISLTREGEAFDFDLAAQLALLADEGEWARPDRPGIPFAVPLHTQLAITVETGFADLMLGGELLIPLADRISRRSTITPEYGIEADETEQGTTRQRVLQPEPVFVLEVVWDMLSFDEANSAAQTLFEDLAELWVVPLWGDYYRARIIEPPRSEYRTPKHRRLIAVFEGRRL